MSRIPHCGDATHVAFPYFKDHPEALYHPDSFDIHFEGLLQQHARKIIPRNTLQALVTTPLWRQRIIDHWKEIAAVILDSQNDEVWIEPTLADKRFLYRGRYHRPPIPDIIIRQQRNVIIVDAKVSAPATYSFYKRLTEQLRESHCLLHRKLGDTYTYEGYGLIFTDDDTHDPAPTRCHIPLPTVPSP